MERRSIGCLRLGGSVGPVEFVAQFCQSIRAVNIRACALGRLVSKL